MSDGALSFALGAGAHTLKFDGRLSHSHKLAPGRYTVLVTAAAGGVESAAQTLTFTIVR